MSFFSGDCEGCAERDRLNRQIAASVRPDLDSEFNVEPGLKGKVGSDIVGTSLDKSDEIDALAKLPETEQRRLTRVAKAGKKVSAKTRIKQLQLRGRFSPRAPGG